MSFVANLVDNLVFQSDSSENQSNVSLLKYYATMYGHWRVIHKSLNRRQTSNFELVL